jgi:TolB-like protein
LRFLAELKRRNVIRMAGLYLVGAWLIVQVAGTVLPMFGAPDWVARSVVILLAIGFLPALLISWVFELTPEGLRREGEAGSDASLAPQTARRMDRMIIVVMALALSYFAIDKFLWNAAPQASSTAQLTPPPAAAGHADGLVAVLPFRNLSERSEDAYFSEGMHDDLLTQLSKIAGLKVISRTSMVRYADSGKSIPEIARELGAAVVLEGSVQRAGDQVRINVQLIDGDSDVHLWAEKYDRALSTQTLFAIQAEIAQAIASAMQVVLSPAQASALAAGSTSNLQAYESLLQGKLLLETDRLSPERLQAALAHFDRAIALDPQFADAWAHKARAQLAGYWFGLADRSMRDAAIASIGEAQRLAPDSIETLMAQAYLEYWGELDYAGAEAIIARVIERAPDNAQAWFARGAIARRDGRFDDAIAAMQRSLSIDSVNNDAFGELAWTLAAMGRFDEAQVLLERAAGLGLEVRFRRIQNALLRGDAEAAWALAAAGPTEPFVDMPYSAALASRDPQRIARALSPELWPLRLRQPPTYPEAYAMAHAEGLLVSGQREQALAELRAIKARLQALENPYPGGWAGDGYLPSTLPGMLGDLDGVRAAERDYVDNAPRDAFATLGILPSLAEAFARAGDPERALTHLETLTSTFGPSIYLSLSMHPGLDSLHAHPRWLALKLAYENWAAARDAQ